MWLIKSDSTKLEKLTQIKGGVGVHYKFSYDFSWSPDSKYIALSHQPYVPPWKDEPRPESTIDVINISTKEIKEIASFEARINHLSWLPDGEKILFMKERVGFLYKDEVDYEWIQTINIRSRYIHTLVKFDGLQQFLQPKLSPDGKMLALMYDADNPLFYFMRSIGLVSITDDDNLLPINRLTSEIKLDSPHWSNDNNHVYALRDYGAYKQIYKINTKTAEAIQITNDPLNIESYSLSQDGSKIAWVGQSAHGDRIIRMASNNGQNVIELNTLQSGTNDIYLSEVREVTWSVHSYPSDMKGLLILPLNYQENMKYPLIVDIHGGDVGAHIYLLGGLLVTTPLEWQMWSAKGYAVFIPEFRSSASFGSLAVNRDVLQEFNRVESDFQDIEAGVDMLIDLGVADPKRLSIVGHSAGALRANWFAVKSNRYQAIISKEGWADELSLASSFPASKRMSAMYGGSPQEVPQNYLKNSPLAYSSGAKTPTLFIMCNPELGGIDKTGTTLKLYNSFIDQGVEAQFIQYSDEGHNIEKAINRRDVLERAVDWIDKHN